MPYTLITKTGRVIGFYVLALAEIYQQAYGGVLFTADILQTVKETVEETV